MTALSKDTQRVEKEGKLLSFPVKGSVKIFHNALLKIGADGFAAPCASEAGAAFVGMAYEAVDASASASGEKSVRVELKNVFEVAGSGFVQADLLKLVYAVDDNTVSLTDSGDLQAVGRIVEVLSATSVMVQPILQTK